MTRTDLELYTKSDLEKARTKGQLVGWVQGGAVVLAGAVLLSFLGWIPTLVVLGAGGFLIYKLTSSSKHD
jgi:hypothetical protein